MLTQSELKSFLHYCPDTGVFTRIACRHARFVGKPAGVINGSGYRNITVDGRSYLAHRLAVLYMEGYTPKENVDHKNGIRSDLRWCNLRVATYGENKQNTSLQKNNTSGYKGVYYRGGGEKCWIAKIQAKGVTTFLGGFSCPVVAHEAYKKAALEQHGEFANFG